MLDMQRRNGLQFAIIFIAVRAHISWANGLNHSKNSLLPMPVDLRQAAQAAALKAEPLILMLSLPGCPWCELLRRNYLLPMRGEGAAVYECMVNDSTARLRDAQGRLTSPQALAHAWKITITPTVVFLNAQGQEIAPRIEGVASADFIGAVLDERLALARAKIKAAS
jgi:thioredoxin-related protein